MTTTAPLGSQDVTRATLGIVDNINTRIKAATPSRHENFR